MNKTLRALLDKKTKLVAEARGITTKAEGEGRDLSAEEQTQFDGIMAQVNSANAAIDRERDLIAQEAQLGISAVTNFNVTENIEQDARRGFRSFGDFAGAVASASLGRGLDQRLAAAPQTSAARTPAPTAALPFRLNSPTRSGACPWAKIR